MEQSLIQKNIPPIETDFHKETKHSDKIDSAKEIDNYLNFNHLEDLIHSNNENSIELDENISILDNEIYFYEGGIELDKDGLTIDGNDKWIDGCGKTRIFNVVGKDITLKNIIFKNGSSLNGGGAIKIVKGASLKLINCKFIDNSSLTDGGAILNNGELKSIQTTFEGNKSKIKGGGIFNNGTLTVEKSNFRENRSRSGSSIYNNDSLIITKIDFDEEIFNNSSITTSMILEENVTNIGFINREEVEVENFTYLFNEINLSSEIILEKDIIFNYIEDKDLVNGFEISKNLTVEGNDHIIDGNGSARLFNVMEDAEIVFKNLIFKNCYTSKQAIIENNSSLRFENCRFINNHPRFNESLIENNNELKIIDSSFSNHYVKRNSLLVNNKRIEIKNSSFIGNSTETKGSVLFNFNKTDIKGSTFENNFSKELGGAILNSESGRVDILSTKFIENISDEYGGAIFNYGDSTILDTKFFKNSSKRNGGAIYNALNPQISGKFVSDFIQNLLIDGCDFINNGASGTGGALFNDGVLDLQLSDFIENFAELGGAIYMGDNGIAYMGMCSFKKNKAEDGGAIYQKQYNINFRNCSVEDNIPNDTNQHT